MTDFISDNPALTAFYQTRNNDRAQQEGDIQLRQAQQTEGANNAIDADLRAWFQKGQQQPAAAAPAQAPPAAPEAAQATPAPSAATPAPAAPPAPSQQAPTSLSGIGITPDADSMSHMAQTPGTGRYLMGLHQAGYQRRQDMTFRMFDAMDKGDLPQAQYLSQAVGFNLPPQAWQDVRTIRTLGQAKYFMPLYKEDEAHFGTFLSDAMRSADANGGVPDWQGALKRNAPRSKGQVSYEGYTAATGEKPSQFSAEAMFGGRDMRPFAPSFGTATIEGPDGKPQVVQINKRDPNAAPVPVGNAARVVAPLTGTATVQGDNGPEVVSVDRRSGQRIGTVGAAAPRSAPITQIDRDRKEAEGMVGNDPSLAGAKPEVRDAAIKREMDRIAASRRPAIAAPRVDQGPAQSGAAQAPAGQQAHAGTQQDPHQPQSQADFDALPKGAIYVDPGDGKPYRKP